MLNNNIIQYKRNQGNSVVYCMVDNSHTLPGRAKQVIKNIADFTVSNLYIKGIDLLQGEDENILLTQACELKYKHAVVFNIGTEFINGSTFFQEIQKITATDYFLAGHILDRKDAYYELHHQCYLVNLEQYSKLGSPNIGSQELGVRHRQERPWRSVDNWHDDYTPVWVSGGDQLAEYNHKCHGWNILKIAFDEDLPVVVFDADIRNSKIHHYPESTTAFNKSLQWLYFRYNHCANDFVHTSNTDTEHPIGDLDIEQIVIPASGVNYVNDSVDIVVYDYNQKALDFWAKQFPNCKFKKIDLLGEEFEVADLFDVSKRTFLNLSNIFCYEGTCAFTDLEYRVFKENQLLRKLQEQCPNVFVNFTNRAAMGFAGDLKLWGYARDFQLTDITTLTKPTYWFSCR